MGRSIPPIPLPTHPSLAIFLFVAWVAAAMAVVLSFCTTCYPKSSADPSKSSSSDESVAKPAAEVAEATAVQEEGNLPMAAPSKEEYGEGATPVTVIDDVATHGALPPMVLPRSASKRKMTMSFSRVVHDKLKASRREWRGDGGEDSLWKKTIILGEKCRVGSGDQGEEAAVVVDENGNPQQCYHPRSPRSRQASRNSSFANHNEAPTTT